MPVLAGTRMPVQTLIDYLDAGFSGWSGTVTVFGIDVPPGTFSSALKQAGLKRQE
jgi:hypothetical protein